MLRIVALIIFSCLVAICGKDTTVVNKKNQLSGEIINPAFDYFILTQKRGFRDTIFLDENNRFSHTFDTEHLGLINFVHNEQQLIHIEKGDSIEMSLDTNAFDESLKYTGKGVNLSAKFPEYDFIGININTESDMWRRQLEKYAIENTKQYRFENSVTGKIELLVQKLEKIIIVDKDGMILNAFSNLKRPNFEEELVSYLKP